MAVVDYAQLNPFTTATPPYGRLTKQLAQADHALASGQAYPSAAANPSLSVVQQLQAQSATYRQAQKNGVGAASLFETAAQGLSTIRDLLATLRGFAVQASDANITTGQRGYLRAAFAQGLADIDTVAQGTSFGGMQLLNGDASPEDGGASIPIVLGPLPEGVLNADIRSVATARLFPSTPNLADATSAQAAVTAVDAARALFEPVAGTVAGYQASVTSAAQVAAATLGGTGQATKSLSGTDVPAVTQLLRTLEGQQQTSLAVLAQAHGLNSGLLNLLRSELSHILLH